MGRILRAAVAAIGLLAVAVSTPALPQSNDDDYTPLNSRIKRARQFPTDLPPNHIPPEKMTKSGRERSRAMLNQFSKCIYNRSREDSVELLDKTDFGFASFEQIGLNNDRALRIYGFSDCLRRVASTNNTGVSLRFSAGGLRQWLIQEAYLDRYADGPEWVKPGNVIAARAYPLSERDPSVHAAMDFADWIVAEDPYDADFYYRTTAGSDDEKQALDALVPSLGPCLPQGVQMQIQPVLRLWLGEALWHAATNSAPAPAEAG